MPSERELLEALDRDTVDTSRWMVDDVKEAKYQMERAENKIYGLAVPQVDGTLKAWHVTDEPEKVIKLLKTKGDFYAREGDLCGGLYVSAVPHFWEGRSERKWDFLPKMTREERFVLYDAISKRLIEQGHDKYITKSEFERAMESMDLARESDRWQILEIVANQPYNINIPKMAEALGLAKPFKPPYIQVDFVGRYLEFNTQRAIDANEELLRLKHGTVEGLTRTDLCNMLKGYGWDGVFTKAGMGTNPELVIWNGDRIIAFGEWVQSPAELSAVERRGFVIVDPQVPRFQAWVSPGRTIADVEDTELKSRLLLLKIEDVQHLKGLIEGVLAGSSFFDPRGMSYNDVPSYYTYSVYTALSKMDELTLRELLALVKRLEEALQ